MHQIINQPRWHKPVFFCVNFLFSIPSAINNILSRLVDHHQPVRGYPPLYSSTLMSIPPDIHFLPHFCPFCATLFPSFPVLQHRSPLPFYPLPFHFCIKLFLAADVNEHSDPSTDIRSFFFLFSILYSTQSNFTSIFIHFFSIFN